MARKPGIIRPNPIPKTAAIEPCAECSAHQRTIRCNITVAEAEQIAAALRASAPDDDTFPAVQAFANYFDALATVTRRRNSYDEY